MVLLPIDNVGEEVFGDFAEIGDVADGDSVVAFWKAYVEFSKDPSNFKSCEESCTVAVEMNSRRDGIQSIALCSVLSLKGILGSPAQCYTVITSKNGRTFVRAAYYMTNIEGLDGLGNDEIACVATSKNAELAAISDEIGKTLNGLNDPPRHTEYTVDVKNKGGVTQIRAINRFASSAFFYPSFEISTITIEVFKGDDGLQATIAPTVLLSNTASEDQDRYTAINDSQSHRLEQKLISLMPKALRCKVSQF
jgi:hypothetical protein